MELVDPPSHKKSPTVWVILLICCALLVLVFLGLESGRQGSPRHSPIAVDAVPLSAPAEPAPAAPAPAGQEAERMLVRAPEPNAPAPAPASAPAARTAQEPAHRSPAPAAAVWKPAKHLKVTRHLGGAPSRTAAVLPAPLNDRPAIPAAPAAREAPEEAHQAPAAAAAPVASTRYGVTSREQIMGQAAGPVYNLKGRGRKPAAPAPGRAAGSANEAQEPGDERQDDAGAASEE